MTERGARARPARAQSLSLSPSRPVRAHTWWSWLAAAVVAFPGGGIAHLLITMAENED